MFCKKCNKEYPNEQKYCGVCGEKLCDPDEKIQTVEVNDREEVDFHSEEKSSHNSEKKEVKKKSRIIVILVIVAFVIIQTFQLGEAIKGKEKYREFDPLLWDTMWEREKVILGDYSFIYDGEGVDNFTDWIVMSYGRDDFIEGFWSIESDEDMTLKLKECIQEEVFKADKDVLDMQYIGMVNYHLRDWKYYKVKLKKPERIQKPEVSSWNKGDEIYIIVTAETGVFRNVSTYISVTFQIINLDASSNNEDTDDKLTTEPENVIAKDNNLVIEPENITTKENKEINVNGYYSFEIPKSWEGKYKVQANIPEEDQMEEYVHKLSFYEKEDFLNGYGGILGYIELLPMDTYFPSEENDPEYYGIYWSAVDYLGTIETAKGKFHIISRVPREGGNWSEENEELYFRMSDEFISEVIPSITPLEGYEYKQNFRAN